MLMRLFIISTALFLISKSHQTILRDVCVSDRELQVTIGNLAINREIMNEMLLERISDTKGHAKVKTFIIEHLSSIHGLLIERHEFYAQTPLGLKKFTNILATLNPYANDRYVFAAHYDSKYFKESVFIGATDSAVPCSILLQVAEMLPLLNISPSKSVQFIFFDGEEAFVEWTQNDKLYGSRELAPLFAQMPCSYVLGSSSSILLRHRLCFKSRMDEIKLFTLLDLLGTSDPWPSIHDYLLAKDYIRYTNIETRLANLNLLSQKRLKGKHLRYFVKRKQDPLMQMGSQPFVDDDHAPFVEYGIQIVHAIPYPFPKVWHTLDDDASIIDIDVTNDFLKIFTAFIIDNLR